MITRELLAHILDRLVASGRVPADLARYAWAVVPAGVRTVEIPVERPSVIVTPLGDPVAAAPEVRVVDLHIRVPLTGVRYVTDIRLGYDADARTVVWSVE